MSELDKVTAHYLDLITQPEILPLIVSYHNVYASGRATFSYKEFGRAEQERSKESIAIVETTFDPNTDESSAKTVWHKGESV